MEEQPPEKQPIKRILEVDRKLAAQLYDVWVDMKLRIEADLKKKKEAKPKQSKEDYENPY